MFRLVFPKLDRLRASYGVQESFLGKFYTQILSLPEQEKQMLKHWKNPNYQPEGAPVYLIKIGRRFCRTINFHNQEKMF